MQNSHLTADKPTSSHVSDFNYFVKDPNKKARSLVRRITHSGDTDLDKDDLNELKQLCKVSNDGLMIEIHKSCMKYLAKEHSQVRVSTTKLLDYLFRKSHIIRDKLLDDFDVFIELTLAITQKPKVKLKLPPPKKYAALLQELTAKTIHKWHADFGEGYEKLRYAHRFLKEHRLVDFSRFQVNSHEQLIKQQKLAEQQEKVITRAIENRLKEYQELKPAIQQLLAQIESLIDILVPTINEDTNVEPEIDHDFHCQRHGIANLSQKISIEFSPYVNIEKSAENKDIVQNLRDLKKELVEGKLVRLIAIEKTINKRSERLVDTLKEIIDIKTQATNIILKLGELRIIDADDTTSNRNKTLDDDSDDDDNDFQEVDPKDDIEEYIPKSMRHEYGLESIHPKEFSQNTSVTLTDESFGSDIGAVGSSSSGTSLVIACNVLLDNGKLCPRRDKIKCPFHGKIIPRDHLGVPLDENIRLEEERRAKSRKTIPDWQDPELLADIKAATGVDLTMPTRGSRNQLTPKKKLLNQKICDLTPKQRIQKRLKALSK